MINLSHHFIQKKIELIYNLTSFCKELSLRCCRPSPGQRSFWPFWFCYHHYFSDHPGNELLWAAMGWEEASCWWRWETAWRRSCQQRKNICISLGLAKEGGGRQRPKKMRAGEDFLGVENWKSWERFAGRSPGMATKFFFSISGFCFSPLFSLG